MTVLVITVSGRSACRPSNGRCRRRADDAASILIRPPLPPKRPSSKPPGLAETGRSDVCSFAASRTCLLARHRQLEAFLRCNQVIVIVLLQIDRDPVPLAVEFIVSRVVVR